MKLSENIYQISGIPFGNNSNSYVIDAGRELILIDTGYSATQWQTMKANLIRWNLQDKPITHTFITHAHFDHSGNAGMSRQEGSRVIAGPGDAKAIEERGACTLYYLFKETFNPCVVDIIAIDGDRFRIGETEIQTIGLPGHTAGSLAFQVVSSGLNCLFTGDFFTVTKASPEDELMIELGWQGSPDFQHDQYIHSLERATTLKIDCMLPGHLSAYYGDCHKVFTKAYEMALAELK